MMSETLNEVPLTTACPSGGSMASQGVAGQRGKKGGSASSQGSGRSHREEVIRRDSSTSSDQSDGEERRAKSKRRTQRKSRRPAFSTEEDDDERTDSADECVEDTPKDPPSPPTQSGVFYNQYSTPFNQAILKPLSPTTLHVGYGSELVGNADHGETVSGLNSPRLSECGQVSSDALSPEINTGLSNNDQDQRINLSAIPPKPVTIATAGSNSVLPSPSLAPSTTNTALPFAGWGWAQPTANLYSPFCGPSGSTATTPAVNDGGLTPFLPPGANTTYLPAIVYQELDGVLVVNVRWRNKTFSGSLIDLQHHEWAPPRLAESVPDMSVKLNDLFAKQDSEKEAIDVVAVMEDQQQQPKENGEQEKETVDMTTEPPPQMATEKSADINSSTTQYSDVTDGSDNEAGIDKSKFVEHSSSLKPPNGLQVPTIMAATPTSDEKPKATPSLPSFDAVKSPQPQLAAVEDKEGASTKSREDTPPPAAPSILYPHSNATGSVIVTTGVGGEHKNTSDHHNFNTLVDVAAAMKPVHDEKSSDDTLSDKETSSHDGFKSTVTYHPSEGHAHHRHGNGGEDSDSSGSGSLSPVKKKTHAHHKKGGGVGVGGAVIVPETFGSKAALMAAAANVKEDSKQPDTPSFNTVPFQFALIPPISPGEQDHVTSDKNLIQPPKVMKAPQFWSPAVSSIGKELDSRFPPNVDTSNPSAHLVPSLVGFAEHGSFPGAGHVMSGAAPPHTVIHGDKVKLTTGRKRKSAPSDSDSNKRPTPSPKEMESILASNKPLPPLPPSFTNHHGGDPTVIISSASEIKPPDGFVYEPSLPMSKEYQIIAYQRQRAAEVEKQKDRPPKIKRPRENPPSSEHGRAPSPSTAFKRGGGIGSGLPPPPGVVMSDHVIHRHAPPAQIKQETNLHIPSRPPSKGHHHMSTSSGSSSSGSLNKLGLNQDKKRMSSRPKMEATASIKKEPSDPIQWGTHTQFGMPLAAAGLPQAIQPHILNLPPGISMPISSSPSAAQLTPNFSVGPQYGLQILPPGHPTMVPPLPPPSAINKPKLDSAHSGRTPSPNPKKSNDWPPHPPHPSGHPHVITPTPTKPELVGGGSSRHGNQHSVDSKSHVRMGGHQSSRHKQQEQTSSRHSSHPQPSPTHQNIRNGITPIISGTSNDDLMKMQMLQLEMLQKTGAAPIIQTTQDLLAWQARINQMVAMGQLPVDQATLQMQLAVQQQQQVAAMVQQQQQQQQQNEAALANFQALAAQGMPVIPFVQSLPLAPTAGIPFALHPPPPPKRDS